eukprot:m.77740 g.77740  ORF g.77740 m.77740 type:complete len:613 (+) comp12640_c0_seq1:521-2359(+)
MPFLVVPMPRNSQSSKEGEEQKCKSLNAKTSDEDLQQQQRNGWVFYGEFGTSLARITEKRDPSSGPEEYNATMEGTPIVAQHWVLLESQKEDCQITTVKDVVPDWLESLQRMKHANVLAFMGMTRATNTTYGKHFAAFPQWDETLFHFVQREGPAQGATAWDWSQQIAEGLSFLHDTINVVHRTLSSKCICVQHDHYSDGLDFDHATMKIGGYYAACHPGTLTDRPAIKEGMAPEVSANSKAAFSEDIWCCGAIFREIFTGKGNFDASSGVDLTEKNMRAMFALCRQPIPENRPSAKKLVRLTSTRGADAPGFENPVRSRSTSFISKSQTAVKKMFRKQSRRSSATSYSDVDTDSAFDDVADATSSFSFSSAQSFSQQDLFSLLRKTTSPDEKCDAIQEESSKQSESKKGQETCVVIEPLLDDDVMHWVRELRRLRLELANELALQKKKTLSAAVWRNIRFLTWKDLFLPSTALASTLQNDSKVSKDSQGLIARTCCVDKESIDGLGLHLFSDPEDCDVIIANIDANSPCSVGALPSPMERGDVLVGINGSPVGGLGLYEVLKHIAVASCGDTIVFNVVPASEMCVFLAHEVRKLQQSSYVLTPTRRASLGV